MSDQPQLALIEIKCFPKNIVGYESQTAPWVSENPSITSFDFDNRSDSYTSNLAIKLLEQSDHVFVIVQDTNGIDQLGSISSFLNTIIRKHRSKVRVVQLGFDPNTAPFYKVLKAEQAKNYSEIKTVFDSWIRGFRNDPSLPGKEIDL